MELYIFLRRAVINNNNGFFIKNMYFYLNKHTKRNPLTALEFMTTLLLLQCGIVNSV